MKTLKVTDKTHERLAKHAKRKSDTYNVIINRTLDMYERVPEIRKLVVSAFNAQLNQCMGNMEKTRRIKEERSKVMSLLKGERIEP